MRLQDRLAVSVPRSSEYGSAVNGWYQRPAARHSIPGKSTEDEVAGLLAHLEGVTALLARLLYGTGMRLMEGIHLRVKNMDFDRQVIIVRAVKGNKNRVAMLPRSMVPAMGAELLAARAVWQADRQACIRWCRKGYFQRVNRRLRSGPGSSNKRFRSSLCTT